MKNAFSIGNVGRQRGAALVISLLLLLVMTLLGLAAMQVTRMEERMAGNTRDLNIAFQGAEAGLRDAEGRLFAMTARPGPCSAPPCVVWRRDLQPFDLRDEPDAWWTGAETLEYGVAGAHEITDSTRDPRTITEEMGFLPDSLTIGHGPPEGRNFYKITSNSTGASDTASAVLETTYTRRF